jgi:Protein of unknown function (DUF642)
MRATATIVLALTCATLAQADARKLLNDGGFEQPPTPNGGFNVYNTGQKFANWTVTGATGNVGTVSTTFTQNGYSFPAKSGKAWLDLTGTSNTATGVAQTIKTAVGTTYTVTFWIGNVVNPGGIFGTTSTVDVYAGTTLLTAATNSKGTGGTKLVWQKFTTSFTATAATTTLSFINCDPSNDTNCGLDMVSVTAN